MIEGLKVTIEAAELEALARKRARHFAEKADLLRMQLPTLESLDVPNTSNRPGEAAKEKIKSYELQAAEMEFIASHLDKDERYQLNGSDLHKLGIAYSAY